MGRKGEVIEDEWMNAGLLFVTDWSVSSTYSVRKKIVGYVNESVFEGERDAGREHFDFEENFEAASYLLNLLMTLLYSDLDFIMLLG